MNWGDVGKWGIAAGTLGIMPASIAAGGYAAKQLASGGGGDGDMSWGDVPYIGSWLGPSRADVAMDKKIAGMKEAAQHYAAYRPIANQQRMNALNKMGHLFEPVNNALGQMYGPQAQFDLSSMGESPMVQQNLWPASPMPEAPPEFQYNQSHLDRVKAQVASEKREKIGSAPPQRQAIRSAPKGGK